MLTDRNAALREANQLLRQGKLDGAIEAYVRLVEAQPRDWNSINALGDLWLRAGDVDLAVAQFTRVADQFFADGSFQKAAAMYKKTLRAKGDHEPALRQLGEIAVQQGLQADAEVYLQRLADLFRHRGDERGAAESLARLRTLKEAEADSRIAEARAAEEIGDIRKAATLLRTAANDFEHEGRRAEAVDLLLSLARMELASQEEHHARTTLTRVLTAEPGRRGEVVAIAIDLARSGLLESALGCIDVAIDAALLDADRDGTVDVLQTFTRAVPYVPALVKLVEFCVDAGVDTPLRVAQARLADAYLEEGRGLEARTISEDLLDHDPGSEDHARRLVRALNLLGVADTVRLVGERSSGGTAGGPPEIDVPLEVDLSDALADMAAAPAEAVAAPSVDPCQPGLDQSQTGSGAEEVAALESAARDPRTRFAATAALGRLCVRRGDLQAGVEWLERAVEVPPANPEEGFAVLYDLADALDRFGETARALAVLIELDLDSGGYRDGRARIDRIVRAGAGSPGQ